MQRTLSGESKNQSPRQISMESVLISSHTCRKLHLTQSSSILQVFPRSNNLGRRGVCLRRPIVIPKVRRSIPPIKNSENPHGERRFGPRKAVAGASLALACALSILGFKMMNPTAIAGPRQMVFQKAPPAAAPITPQGGKAALKSLLDVSVALASSDDQIERSPRLEFQSLPPRASKADVDAMKMEAVRLMKIGKSEAAVDYLRRAYRLYEHEPETAYNVQLALVEILICQGRYEEADECGCLHDDDGIPSDVRPLLYKAIIQTMLNREDEAKACWKAFRKTIGEGFDPFENLSF